MLPFLRGDLSMQRTSFVGGQFQHDIFGSYSTGPRADSFIKAWSHTFLRDIEIALIDQEPKIVLWWDEYANPTFVTTKQLHSRVASSCLLIILMTRHYLESPWCYKEHTWFAKQVKHRREKDGLVFLLQ